MDKTKEVLQEAVNQLRNQASIEVNRFKQDCRKKALEMAHSEANSYLTRSSSSFPQTLGTVPFNVITKADEYYQWLTKEV